MASNLVVNNMATLVAVSLGNHVVYSMYPSEPVLSEAAAQIMASNKNYSTMLAALYTQIWLGVMSM
jgi:hypothetical protein